MPSACLLEMNQIGKAAIFFFKAHCQFICDSYYSCMDECTFSEKSQDFSDRDVMYSSLGKT